MNLNTDRMKECDIKRIKRYFIWIVIFTLCFTSCDVKFWGKTYKNYYYSEDGKNCVTIILYTAGDGFSLIKSCSSKYDPLVDDKGRGIYIIPGKFEGRLPENNYLRLDYIGGLPTNAFYFRWNGDSLIFRIDNWAGVILENKFSPSVKLDTIGILDYERGWFQDSIRDKVMLDEWKNMRKRYQYVIRKDLKVS